MRPPTLRDWLARAPFGLALSSGFFGFFAHAGMLLALEEAGLAPARVSGSSAGALVGALWSAGLSARRIANALVRLRRRDFWDPAPGLGLLRGRRFATHLASLLPIETFEQCRVPVAISTYDVLGRRTHVMSAGPIIPAIRASCAVPLLFHPVWLAGRPHLDGGIADRPGLFGQPLGRILFHHLANEVPRRRGPAPLPDLSIYTELTALVIDDLPWPGPFALEQGPRALDAAAEATRRALELPLVAPTLKLSASRCAPG